MKVAASLHIVPCFLCVQAEKIPDKWFMVAAATVAQSLDEKDLEAGN